MKFADLGLSDELLSAVADAGYDEPTPIQAQAIPPVLMMKDIIGIAQTGTGKTASFVLPMIDVLAHGRSRARMPRSLILEPTRELAAQVAENFEKYGKNHNLSMALLIGGVSMGDQVKALEKGVDVLIATPGRLMDLFERGRILMSGCELLVIDEADRMLDMGFIPDIEEICSKLPATRQTMLFSATMPPPIKKLSDQFLTSPKYIEVSRPATANTSIDQSIIHIAPRGKQKLLYGILDNEGVETAIIFCNRKTQVRDLCQQLRKDGFDAGQIHGDMDQTSRLAELERFKSGEINILCASDVAARGLDIKGVSHVVNFDIPWHPDDYIHRIGRTGRAGATGVAITFVTRSDSEHVENIEKLTGMKLPVRDSKSVKPEKKPSYAKADKKSDHKDDRPKSGESGSGRPKQRKDGKSLPRNDNRPSSKPPKKEKSQSPSPKPAPARDEADDQDGDGWNGPVPGFLDAKLDR
ncbi:Superfamily II DNA and RNA helicase [Parasphingorhabdus marina DSM 22363]|uniref:DEAD-box ATP-dependent RNA helicase RhpA n=1 Tax=Parasphingorhabdus marina DSM 22363 TaxID=1123272 RepID=A0A1N6CM56_9SPHN|nr:DEAD/DEAH box helicase [Parasphingorhabdus marina]SIN59658.1 Superfamily II DNA and RNA helicase [Parasphingorhabdus marina DSM 22363]